MYTSNFKNRAVFSVMSEKVTKLRQLQCQYCNQNILNMVYECLN